MRVMLLTPGTGHFYCGSCLRDDALGRALHKIGHDVSVVPLYLPMLLEQKQPEQTVHMGGINVYLQQKTKLARFVPRFLANWLNKPSLLRWAARRGNMTNAADLGSLTVSILRGEDGRQALEIEKLAEWIATQPRPDVVIVSNAMLIGMVRRLRSMIDTKVVVTLQGESPFLDSLPKEHSDAAWDALRERANDVHGLIAVSQTHGDAMQDRLDLDRSKLHVVHNGIEVEHLQRVSNPKQTRGPKTIGYLARMCSDKGLDILVDAFLILKKRNTIKGLRLRVAGVQLPEDGAYIKGLKNRIADRGATREVDFLPNVERAEKVAFLHSLSVLSVPARYQESFGLYLLEAMAAGVPVVQPQHASFPEVLKATGGGVLYEPHNAQALADSLESLLLDEDATANLGKTGHQNVTSRFTSARMALQIADICQELVSNSFNTTTSPKT